MLAVQRYTVPMASSAHRLLQDVLALPENERLELASEIIASVDGPGDADWEQAWLAELDRRVDAASARGDASADWTEARARILKRLGRA
jgi:putative addiction module component (TIGR02574 family)